MGSSRPSARGQPVANAGNINGGTDFDLKGSKGSAVLLWITDVGTSPCGSIGPCTQIDEATVIGS